jgi:FAD/FMN-containing dehydrogenase
MINDTISGNIATGGGGGIFSAGLTGDGSLSLSKVFQGSDQ